MKSTSPWSVKGVDDDARELARNAAQAAGLTLGAWIDRAIKKSTGLAPVTPGSISSTTASTTSIETSDDDAGQFLEAPESARSEAPAASIVPSIAAEATADLGPGDATSDDFTTPLGLQADPEERFGVGVDHLVTPRPRRWPSLPGARRWGVPVIGVAAVACILIAGVLVYLVAGSGGGDEDPATSSTERIAAATAATPPPPTPDGARRDDTPPPSEPGVIEMLTAAAEQGDAIAQHDLAVRYLDSKTVARDYRLAVLWMERAASQGMASAQHRLAVMFAEGTGGAPDPNRAAMWHTRAASQGHPGSQHALALAYAAGKGVRPSEASAVEWLERAARAGNVASQVLLGERYENGSGVVRDAARASEWYRRAAAKGDVGAVARLKSLATTTQAEPPAPTGATAPAAMLAPADAPLDKAGIAEVQRLLARLAFKPGPADGVLGSRTVREIKLYQSFAGLPADGKATYGLLQELREMVRGMSAATKPAGS